MMMMIYHECIRQYNTYRKNMTNIIMHISVITVIAIGILHW